MFYGNFHNNAEKRRCRKKDSLDPHGLFMSAKRARFLNLIIPCMIFILPWLIGYFIFMGTIFSQKIQSPEMTTDAIIVVTGGAHRINAGFDLMAEKKARQMLISGVDERVTLPDLLSFWNGTDSENTDLSTIECCVTLGHAAENTNSNAQEARDWLYHNNLYSVRLVTSDYHMPRTSLAFRLALPDITIYKHPVKNPDLAGFNVDKIMIGFREYNKTLLTLALSFMPQ